MRRGALQRVHDLVEVPLRIRLRHRIPIDFLAEHDFAIDDGGGLAVAGARDRSRCGSPSRCRPSGTELNVLSGKLAGTDGDNLERPLEDPAAHDVRVERARLGLGVVALKSLAARVARRVARRCDAPPRDQSRNFT